MNKVEKSKLYEDRMAIWNAICETDQKHMKKVSIGSRSFNTVDAQYQIKKMTETFGPVGIGLFGILYQKINLDQLLGVEHLFLMHKLTASL